jgi:hypothetical protein
MKQHETTNLCTKKLTEFTTSDTIYIRTGNTDFKKLWLCNFISYDPKKGIVTGKILEVDEDYLKTEIGKTISARYSSCALYGDATGGSLPYYRWFDSSLYAMHPLEEHKMDENGMHVEKHPSYGLAYFSRMSGGYRALFGSSIQTQQTISLTLKMATHHRSLNNDHFFGEKEIIEVEMSESQFAELITHFNTGSGTPVTIRHINHERYPDPPFQSKADLFSAEFKTQMHNFGVDMKKMVETATEILNNKPSIGKGDRELIAKSIDSLVSHITNGIPFVSEKFQDSMDKTIVEAKAAIEQFIQNRIRETGLAAIADNTPKIDKF